MIKTQCFECFLSFAFQFAVGSVFTQNNNYQTEQPHRARPLWERDFIEAALTGGKDFTVTLQQTGNRTQCMGVIINATTILTSQACKAVLPEHKIAEIIPNTLPIPLATHVLRVDPPIFLSFVERPPTIEDAEEYEILKNQDDVGIVLTAKGPKLVRWYDLMMGDMAGKSLCEEKYSAMQQTHPQWPQSLPKGIFCVREGNQNQEEYTIEIKGQNVTIEAGLPCEDSLGSPILLPDKGLLGVITTADCGSNPQLAFAQSMAYVELEKHQDNSTNQTTATTIELPGANNTIPVFSIGTPPVVYPLPSQYLGPVYIKVYEPTPSGANIIQSFRLTLIIGMSAGHCCFTDIVYKG